jgi:hypothetical protein
MIPIAAKLMYATLFGALLPVVMTMLPAADVLAVPPLGLMPKVALAVSSSIKIPVRVTFLSWSAGINVT